MKVIFLENIEHHEVGDIKDVADGYARNFLIPKNIAVVATPNEIENIEKRLAKLRKEEEEKVKELENLAEKLEKVSLKIEAEAGPKNEEGKQKLFGSITNARIEEELSKKGFEIDKKDIETGEPIKEPGEYLVLVKLGHGVEAELKTIVSVKK